MFNFSNIEVLYIFLHKIWKLYTYHTLSYQELLQKLSALKTVFFWPTLYVFYSCSSLD